jgi:hypothetical protein
MLFTIKGQEVAHHVAACYVDQEDSAYGRLTLFRQERRQWSVAIRTNV